MSDEFAESSNEPVVASSTSAMGNAEATPQLIDQLHSASILNSQARAAALKLVNGPLAWWPWIEKALLFLGLALTLSGVVCFFAWNWDELPGLAKLAIVQTGIVGCCLTAWRKKIDTLSGKSAMTAAAVLVGVFLAVFGQVYQTGADAYQLFVGWALLILPWVVMCRLAGLWILWLAIVNVGVALFWEQMIDPRGIESDWLALVLGLLNGIAATIREVLTERGCRWLSVWTRWILVPAALTSLVVPGFVVIAELDDASLAAWCGLATLLLTLAAVYGQFRIRRPDLFVLTCAATAITVLACGIVIRVIMEVGDEVLAFFLSGFAILALVAAMAHWLMKTGREIRNSTDSGIEESSSPADLEKSYADESAAEGDSSDASSDHSVCRLMTDLAEQELATDKDIDAAYAFVKAEQEEDSTPWFVNALIGFGAWLACLLFLGALAIAGLFDHGTTSVFIGLCLLGGGAFLDCTSNGAFPRQLALAAGLTGLGLTGIGVAEATRSHELSSVTVAVALASAAFYVPFRSDPFRFLSCLISVTLATVWACEDTALAGRGDNQLNLGLHILVLLETLGIGLIYSQQAKKLLQPAGYAMAVGLLGTLLITQFSNNVAGWPSAVTLTLAQLWVLRRAWHTTSNASKQDLGAAVAGTVLLGIASVPGVLASVGLTLLGHLERDAVLKRLGLLFVPVYIASFYYNLETTLLFKSLVLTASGLVLWSARWYFKRQIEQNRLTASETQR